MFSPKNILLMILAGTIIFLGFTLAVERELNLGQKTVIAKLEAAVKELKDLVAGKDVMIRSLQRNLNDSQATIVAMQQVENNTAAIDQAIDDADEKPGKCMEGGMLSEEYARIADRITDGFNNSRVQQKITAERDPGTTDEVLPDPGKAGIAKAGAWTVSDVLTAYNKAADYAEKLEKTIDCYEKK
jgi:hypothetical protein